MVLVLALIGAGSKAGLVPLHVWLPLAHPAAPSHVSALMSGVMTKVAVYGFVRIVFDLLGPPAWWWGAPGRAAGRDDGGAGRALRADAARSQAPARLHTVENIGIIFIGLGLALAFEANEMPAAALALTAALFHVFNHSVFKSLLFFGAGAVLTATGERDMERLGGLIHRMPFTAFAFLIGSAAISALPPFNGFVSEWLTFQAILLSPALPQWLLKFLVPAIGALLALSAALAAACFVKAFGVTFLGRPRTPVAPAATRPTAARSPRCSCFAALCLLAGILPGYFIDALAPVIQALVGARMPRQDELDWLTIVPIAQSRSSYNGLLLFVFIALAAGLAADVIHRWASAATRRPRRGIAAFPMRARPRSTPPAASAADPRVFGTVVFRAREEVTCRRPATRARAASTSRCTTSSGTSCTSRPARLVSFAAERLNQVQFLTIRAYLTLVFGALVGAADGARGMALILDALVQLGQMTLVLALAPLLTGYVRKVKARLLAGRARRSCSPIATSLRLIRKEVVLAHNASWVFRAAPYLCSPRPGSPPRSCPLSPPGLLFSYAADMIAIVALLGQRALHARAGRARRRHQLRRHRLEPRDDDRLARRAGDADGRLHPVAARRLHPALVDRGLHAEPRRRPARVARARAGRGSWSRSPRTRASRSTIPATHLELTMVHEAMILEYSGRHLALIEAASFLKLLLYVSVIACVFVPWGIAVPARGFGAYLTGVAVYVGQARRRRLPARRVRDRDRQDARVPRARLPRRGADARRAGGAAALRLAGALMDRLALDIAHLFAGGLVLVSFMLLYQDRMTGLINTFALHALVVSLSVAWQAYIQGARTSTSPRRSRSSSRRS